MFADVGLAGLKVFISSLSLRKSPCSTKSAAKCSRRPNETKETLICQRLPVYNVIAETCNKWIEHHCCFPSIHPSPAAWSGRGGQQGSPNLPFPALTGGSQLLFCSPVLLRRTTQAASVVVVCVEFWEKNKLNSCSTSERFCSI